MYIQLRSTPWIRKSHILHMMMDDEDVMGDESDEVKEVKPVEEQESESEDM